MLQLEKRRLLDIAADQLRRRKQAKSTSNSGAHFLIQDNWLSVVMLCSYTQSVFDSFRMQQINIFLFFPEASVAATVNRWLFCFWLYCCCGFDGTMVNCFDDAVEAQHVAAGVDQHEHSLDKHEHSFDNTIMHRTTRSIHWNQHEHTLASGWCALSSWCTWREKGLAIVALSVQVAALSARIVVATSSSCGRTNGCGLLRVQEKRAGDEGVKEQASMFLQWITGGWDWPVNFWCAEANVEDRMVPVFYLSVYVAEGGQGGPGTGPPLVNTIIIYNI